MEKSSLNRIDRHLIQYEYICTAVWCSINGLIAPHCRSSPNRGKAHLQYNAEGQRGQYGAEDIVPGDDIGDSIGIVLVLYEYMDQSIGISREEEVCK